MSIYYAQIDETGICYAVSQLTETVEKQNMIPINSYDTLLLGKRWVAETETWEDVPQPAPPPVKTIDEQLTEVKENQLILMDALATIYENTSGGGA